MDGFVFIDIFLITVLLFASTVRFKSDTNQDKEILFVSLFPFKDFYQVAIKPAVENFCATRLWRPALPQYLEMHEFNGQSPALQVYYCLHMNLFFQYFCFKASAFGNLRKKKEPRLTTRN